MTKDSLGYLIREGFHNIRANRQMSIATIGVLIACMILIGGAVMLSLNINSLMGYVESFNEIVVWVKDEASGTDIDELDNELNHMDNISSINYISKEQALEELGNKFGNDSYLEGFSDHGVDNPLPASFRVKVKSLEGMSATENQIKNLASVDGIESSSDVANTLVGIKTAINAAGFVIAAILMVVSIIIIANTIRVTIFNRRREISIMKFVGATNSFIRFPYLVEGVIIGLAAAVLAYCILWVGTIYFYQWVGQSASSWLQLAYQNLVPFASVAPWLRLGFAGAGVLFGMVGSFIFVGKYLKV